MRASATARHCDGHDFNAVPSATAASTTAASATAASATTTTLKAAVADLCWVLNYDPAPADRIFHNAGVVAVHTADAKHRRARPVTIDEIQPLHALCHGEIERAVKSSLSNSR